MVGTFSHILKISILIISLSCTSITSLKKKDNAVTTTAAPQAEIEQAEIEQVEQLEQEEQEEIAIVEEEEENVVPDAGPAEVEIVEEKNKTTSDLFSKDVSHKEDFLLSPDPELVAFWINYFTKRDSERFLRFMKNGEKYRPMIQAILEKKGLPTDLFYVGLIESGYQLNALSHASAKGPWQFIKGTAARYALSNNSYVDERMNVYKSTIASAQYMRDLFHVFHSWPLALAAYNSGEFRVVSAIMRGDTRNFVELSQNKLVPPETRNYVPKVYAAKLIFENPKKYGLEAIEKNELSYQLDDWAIVNTPHGLNLTEVIEKLGIEKASFLEMNRDLLKNIVPGNHRLVIPMNKKDLFYSTAFMKTKVLKDRKERRVASTTRTRQHNKKLSKKSHKKMYVVKKGDHLSNIARRFGISVATLKKANRLKGGSIFPRQKLVIPLEENDS